MMIGRSIRFVQGALLVTYPLWNLAFWIYFTVRALYGLLLLFDPKTHVLTALFHVYLVYVVLGCLAVTYEPKDAGMGAGRRCAVAG